MDQLVVLQEIFESFARGKGTLDSIDPKSISGPCASQIGRLLESIQQGEIDGDLCRRLAECLTDIYELKRLGDVCRRAGLLDVALECYKKALSSSTDLQVRSVLMNNLGQVYARQGDLSRAVLYYKKAVEGFGAVSDSSGAAHVLGNLGSAYRRGYDWDKAVDHCFKSLKTFERMGDELGIAQMTGSLGRVYAEMGEKDLSILYYERSMREFERLGDRRSVAWLLNRLAKVKAEMRNWEGSLEYYTRSLNIFDELNQPNNAGIVLSNLGRMYLDKGDPAAAIDALERGLKLIRREMLPIYPNTISCLAAAYTLMGRECEKKAVNWELSPQAGGDGELLRQASQNYTRASDRFTELSSLSQIFQPDLNVAAGVARSLSYLARIHAETKDGEALALAERAISALDLAVASASSDARLQIEAVRRALTGMKEVWSIGLSKNEPWKLMKGLSDSVENLMGGARSCGEGPGSSQEACRYIYDALKGLSGAVESIRQRRESSEQIRAACSNLRRAEGRFENMDTELSMESALWVRQAAQQLERLVAAPRDGSGRETVYDILNFGAHKSSLLLIGWVLVRSALSAVDRTDWIYVWDDAMNLVELGPASRLEERTKIPLSAKIEDLADIEVDPVLEDEEVVERAIVVNPGQVVETVYQVNVESQWEEDSCGPCSLVPVTAEMVSTPAVVLPGPASSRRYGTKGYRRPERSFQGQPYSAEFFREELSHREPGSRPVYQKDDRDEQKRDRPLFEVAAEDYEYSRPSASRPSISLPSFSLPFGPGTGLAVTVAKVLAASVALLLAIDLVLHLI